MSHPAFDPHPLASPHFGQYSFPDYRATKYIRIHCGPIKRHPIIRWGQDPPHERTFLGVARPIEKYCESLMCCGVCSKTDNSIFNNGKTGRLLQPTAMHQTGQCHITLSPWKNPPAMRPFVKNVWPLVTLRFCTNILRCPL